MAANTFAQNAGNATVPTGFCRCVLRGKPRENLLLSASDLENPTVRCLTCGSTYSAAAPKTRLHVCGLCGGHLGAFGPYGARHYSCDDCGRIDGPVA